MCARIESLFGLLLLLVPFSYSYCQQANNIQLLRNYKRMDMVMYSSGRALVMICENIDARTSLDDSYLDYSDYQKYVIIIRNSNFDVISRTMFQQYRYNIHDIKLTDKLFLRNNGIQLISPGAFRLLKALDQLDLQENQLTLLSRNSFEGLHSLKWLNIAQNKIRLIEDGAFEGLTNLEELQIEENMLTTINNSLLEPLIKLKLLYLSQNSIESITPGAFDSLKNLQELHCQENKLHELPNNVFHATNKLELLNLTRNQINEVEEFTFLGLSGLEKLILVDNNLTSVHVLAFSKLENLKEVHLQNNNLTSISNELFKWNIHLELIDISFNKIKVIESDAFAKLENLKTVYANNNLGNISSDIFQFQTKLEVVDLSGNVFVNICNVHANATFTMKNLHTLLLNESNFQCLPNHWINNSALVYLNASLNDITYVDFFVIPSTLKTLLLSNNNISTIYGANKTNYLEILDMSLNRIPSLPYLSKTLTHLNFSVNEVKHLDAEFASSLEIIDFSFNRIKYIDKICFFKCNNLKHLILRSNKIGAVPAGLFLHVNNLEFLDLSNNQFEIDFGTFSGLKNLKHLNISGNDLDQLQELTFHNLENLETFDISNNSLNSINVQKLLKSLPRLSKINFDRNQFLCYTLFHLIETIKTLKNNIQLVHYVNHSTANIDGISCISRTSTTQSNVVTTTKSRKITENVKFDPTLHLLRLINSSQHYHVDKEPALQTGEPFHYYKLMSAFLILIFLLLLVTPIRLSVQFIKNRLKTSAAHTEDVLLQETARSA